MSRYRSIATGALVILMAAFADPAALDAQEAGDDNRGGRGPGPGIGRQVTIEVNFVEITRRFNRDLGIQFDIPGINGNIPSNRPLLQDPYPVTDFMTSNPLTPPLGPPWS